jgi:KDO2-lipid IV(A) lauroyltransferase
MNETGARRPPLTPAYWPGWALVGLLWLSGKTPQRLALALSRPLGWLLARALQRRRQVAERNIERCFPDWSADRRAALLQESFRSLARMLFEIAWSWSAPDRFHRRVSGVVGLEHLRAAAAGGHGVLVITAHFTCLEIGARAAGRAIGDAAGMYRPLRNPVLEWYQNRSRTQYTECMIPKSDLRAAVRYLKKGGVLWYAPDQDFGAQRSVFVPFFGIPTATLVATERLVQLTGCRVVPMFPVYDRASRRYSVRFWPALDDFPSGDEMRDLTRINRSLEDQVRQAPDQYWWIHRRFKTRPPGEPPFYD